MKKYSKKTIREAIAYWKKQLKSVSESVGVDSRTSQFIENTAKALDCRFVIKVGDKNMIPAADMSDVYSKLDTKARPDLYEICYDKVTEDPAYYDVTVHDDSDFSPEGYGEYVYPDEQESADLAEKLADDKINEVKTELADIVNRWLDGRSTVDAGSPQDFLYFISDELEMYIPGNVDWSTVNGMNVFPIMTDEDNLITLYFRK